MKRLREFLNDQQSHHHIRKICKCGNVITCRCRAEKVDVQVDSCSSCRNEE